MYKLVPYGVVLCIFFFLPILCNGQRAKDTFSLKFYIPGKSVDIPEIYSNICDELPHVRTTRPQIFQHCVEIFNCDSTSMPLNPFRSLPEYQNNQFTYLIDVFGVKHVVNFMKPNHEELKRKVEGISAVSFYNQLYAFLSYDNREFNKKNLRLAIENMSHELMHLKISNHPVIYQHAITKASYLVSIGEYKEAEALILPIEQELASPFSPELNEKYNFFHNIREVRSHLSYLLCSIYHERKEDSLACTYATKTIEVTSEEHFDRMALAHYVRANCDSTVQRVVHYLYAVKFLLYDRDENLAVDILNQFKEFTREVDGVRVDAMQRVLHELIIDERIKNESSAFIYSSMYKLLSDLYLRKSDQLRGIYYLREAIYIFEKSDFSNDAFLAFLKLDLAEHILGQFYSFDGHLFLKECEPLLECITEGHALMLRYNLLLGRVNLKKNDYTATQQCLNYINKYLTDSNSVVTRFISEMLQIDLYYSQKNYKGVLEAIKKLENKEIISFDRKYILTLYQYKAICLNQLGKHLEAIAVCEQILIPFITKYWPTNVINKSAISTYANSLYKQYLLTNDTLLLRKAYRVRNLVANTTISELEIMRNQNKFDKTLELNLLSSNDQIVNTTLRVFTEAGKVFNNDIYLYQAISFLEQLRGEIIEDKVRRIDLMNTVNIPHELIKEYNALWHEYTRVYEEGILKMPSEELIRCIETIEQKEKRLNALYPLYTQQMNIRETPVIDTLQQQLDTDQAILYYHFKDSLKGVFLITSSTIKFSTIPNSLLLDNNIKAFKKILQLPFYGNEEPYSPEGRTQFAQLANYLFTTLIPDYEDLPRKVIIIPDGELNGLPFDAFVTKPVPEGTLYQNLPYMLHLNHISYANSWESLWELKNRTTSPTKDIGVYAPSFASTKNSRFTFQPLKYSAAEINSLKQNWNSVHTFIGKAATKERFLQTASQFQVLHLSTHGISNQEEPDSSFLVLSYRDSSSINPLFYRDIIAQNLNADLVYLSACETGLGRYENTEGIFNIARAFAQAGSKSTVMTSWLVDELATYKITNRFYEQLRKGFSIDVSLNKAKQSYLHETKNADRTHPYFWSGLIPIGDMTPITLINFEKQSSLGIWKTLLIVGILFVMLTFLYLAFYKTKKINSTTS